LEDVVEQQSPRAQAHLIVAAVRVLLHKTGRPPAVEEVAGLLGWSREYCGHLCRNLEAQMILVTLKSPFDVRVDVGDHLRIEDLPEDDSGPRFKDEVEAFHSEFQKRQDELRNLFDSGELEERKKKRLAGLEDELREFKSPRRPDPFGGQPKDES
jgi:hypothetical protein